MLKIVRRNVVDTNPTTVEWVKEFAPYIACGFAAGFSLGIIINLWCLMTALP